MSCLRFGPRRSGLFLDIVVIEVGHGRRRSRPNGTLRGVFQHRVAIVEGIHLSWSQCSRTFKGFIIIIVVKCSQQSRAEPIVIVIAGNRNARNGLAILSRGDWSSGSQGFFRLRFFEHVQLCG